MREQILLNAFLKATELMDIEPLELDRFFHEGFYDSMSNIESNLESLQTFLHNGLQGRKD